MSYHLNVAGIPSAAYHANLDPFKKKKTVEIRWKEGRVKGICETIAFVMGIDKKDRRFVIHYTFSQSLENYFQESRRAERDGNEAYAILFYRFQDRSKVLAHISRIEDPSKKQYELNALNSMVNYCLTLECRKEVILQYFGECPTSDVGQTHFDICQQG